MHGLKNITGVALGKQTVPGQSLPHGLHKGVQPSGPQSPGRLFQGLFSRLNCSAVLVAS